MDNFSGKFHGQISEHLNFACVYYSLFDECKRESFVNSSINLKYRVRPVHQWGLPQLCQPKDKEEDDFSNCKLFKIVAWYHLSYP